MRKVEVEKQPIDLSQKIKVEMTLQELLIVKAATGESSDFDIESHLGKYYEQLGGKNLILNVDSMDVYDDLTSILEDEGIKEDE